MKTYNLLDYTKICNTFVNDYRDLMTIIYRDIKYALIEFETTSGNVQLFFKMFVIIDDKVYEIQNLDAVVKFLSKEFELLNFVSDFDKQFARHLIEISK